MSLGVCLSFLTDTGVGECFDEVSQWSLYVLFANSRAVLRRNSRLVDDVVLIVVVVGGTRTGVARRLE